MLKIIGEKIRRTNDSGNTYTYVDCECTICGRIVSQIYANAIKNESCGCVSTKKLIERSTTHGLTRTPIHLVWVGMFARCYNEKHQHYNRYGGRGILVCDEWNDLSVFYQDMGDRPENASLDRIDNDKGYSKENCRWASIFDQARNRSSSKMVTIDGVTKCAKEWSEDEGATASYASITARLRAGWSPKEAVFGKSARETGRRTGVVWNKKYQKYQAQIGLSGRNVHLGLFDSEQEAIIARETAEVEKLEGRLRIPPIRRKKIQKENE